jgi:hypothetical protein
MGHMPPSPSVGHLDLPDLDHVVGIPIKYTHNTYCVVTPPFFENAVSTLTLVTLAVGGNQQGTDFATSYFGCSEGLSNSKSLINLVTKLKVDNGCETPPRATLSSSQPDGPQSGQR